MEIREPQGRIQPRLRAVAFRRIDAIPKEDEDVSEILFSLDSKIVEAPHEDKITEIKKEPEEEKIIEV